MIEFGILALLLSISFALTGGTLWFMYMVVKAFDDNFKP